MLGTEKITCTEMIASGKNIKLYRYNGKIIIEADNTNTTTIKHGKHTLSGESIEIECGDGIAINTIHPNKLKISIDYKFLIPLIQRLEKLEGAI